MHTWLLIFHPLFSYFYLHFLHSVFISPEIIHTSVFCKPFLSSSLPPSCLTSIFVSVSNFVSMCLGLVAQSCPTPPTHCTVARRAPLSMEFSRQEYWSGLPSPPPGISWPRNQTRVFCIAGRLLTDWAMREALLYTNPISNSICLKPKSVYVSTSNQSENTGHFEYLISQWIKHNLSSHENQILRFSTLSRPRQVYWTS